MLLRIGKKFHWLLVITAAFSLIPIVVHGKPRSEQWDRSVDIVALSVQNKAIARYRKLIRKYRKTSRARSLRILMLEAMEHATNLDFRIAHGDASLRKRAVNYSKYHRRLKDVIGIASVIIRGAPKAQDSVRIYFVRAQARGELKQISKAKKDYDFISIQYPTTTWAVRSNLALADFATSVGLHRVAVARLKKVEEFPDDPHYPYALYKLAWAYFNLKNVPTASSYLVKHIKFYRDKGDRIGKIAPSEQNVVEHSLKDFVLFYFEGLTTEVSDYELDDALSSFRRLETGDYLGQMIVSFANLMRSQDMTKDLDWWQKEIVDEESKRPEAMKVIIVNVEYLLARKKYINLVTSAKSFQILDEKTNKQIRKSDNYPVAQNLILLAAKDLHTLIAKAKNREKSLRLSRTLAGTYDVFIAIVEKSDPRLQKIHYNLGETLYSIQEYDLATKQYVWVLNHWFKKGGLKKAEVSLKAISSRYQLLAQKKRLPQTLKPKELSEDKSPDLEDLKPLMAEWIEWVDEYLDDFGRKPKSIIQFEFEANRVLYAEGQTRAALRRMFQQVKANPRSKVAKEAVSLILDTYVFDKQWELLLEAAEEFLEMKKLGDAAFRKRLKPIPADASFKLLEAAYQRKDYEETLDRVERFEKRYSKSKLLSDSLYIASRSSEELKKPEKSLYYLNQLLTLFPNSDSRSIALLARASLSEETYDFDAATKDYSEYLSNNRNDDDRKQLTKQLMTVNGLSVRPQELNCKKIASPYDLQKQCDLHRALIELAKAKSQFSDKTLIDYGKSHPYKDNRPLWAAVALKFAGTNKRTYFYNRIVLMERVARGFDDQQSLHKVVLVPVINKAIPKVFTSARVMIPRVAPIKSNEKALAKRIELVKRLETAATRIVKLPWARIKISVLHEVSMAYEDFSTELKKLPKPKEISAEELREYDKGLNEMLKLFDDKGKQIAKQVAELASEFPVGPKEVPSLFENRTLASAPKAIDLAMIKSAIGTPGGSLYSKWEKAIQSRSWIRAAFFFGQIKKKEKVPDVTLSLMRAVSLYRAGARPEAVSELESAASDLERGKSVILETIRSQYANSSAANKLE